MVARTVPQKRRRRIARSLLAAGPVKSLNQVLPPANPHLPAGHGIVTIRVSEAWLRAQWKRYQDSGGDASRQPKLEFDVPVRTERTLKQWHPGALVRIEYTDAPDLPGFYVKAAVPNWHEVGYPDPDLKVADSAREKLHVVLFLGSPHEIENGVDRAYADGFSGTANRYSIMDAEERAAYTRGFYDANHLYAYGTSFPGVDATNLGIKVQRGSLDRRLDTIVMELLRQAVQALPHPYNRSKTLRRFLENDRSLSNYYRSALLRMITEGGKSLGIAGARSWISQHLEHDLGELFTRFPQQTARTIKDEIARVEYAPRRRQPPSFHDEDRRDYARSYNSVHPMFEN